jgi:hypothetical protein
LPYTIFHRWRKLLPIGFRAALKFGEVHHGRPLQGTWKLKHTFRHQMKHPQSVALIPSMMFVAMYFEIFAASAPEMLAPLEQARNRWQWARFVRKHAQRIVSARSAERVAVDE